MKLEIGFGWLANGKQRLTKFIFGNIELPWFAQGESNLVDKTRLIFDLASQRRKYLLVRPRGFGKSLLISTFETLSKTDWKIFAA